MSNIAPSLLAIVVSAGTSELKGVYPPAYGAGAEG